MPARFAAASTTCQIALGVTLSPQIHSDQLTRRKIKPPSMAAALVHSSTARFAHTGTRTVRMWFPLPMRSAITECSSRNWRSSIRSPTSSARRSPHPMSSANIARPRLPLTLSGVLGMSLDESRAMHELAVCGQEKKISGKADQRLWIRHLVSFSSPLRPF